MKTKKAMQQTGLRYFSSLSPKQKGNVRLHLVDFALGSAGLPDGLRQTIRKNIELDILLKFNNVLDRMLKRQKIFLNAGSFRVLHGKVPS